MLILSPLPPCKMLPFSHSSGKPGRSVIIFLKKGGHPPSKLLSFSLRPGAYWMKSLRNNTLIIFPRVVCFIFTSRNKKKPRLYQYLMIAIIFNQQKCLPLYKVERQHLYGPCIKILVPLHPLGEKNIINN